MALFGRFWRPGGKKWWQLVLYPIDGFLRSARTPPKTAFMSQEKTTARNHQKCEKQVVFRFLALFFLILQKKVLNITITLFSPWALEEFCLYRRAV